jgi:hypothetical protein
MQDVVGETRKKRSLYKLGLCGIISNWIFKKEKGGLNYIGLAEDKDL